jgi:hypothetical protein
MAKYRARSDLYLGRALIKRGERFESKDAPEQSWEPLDYEARAAVQARDVEHLPLQNLTRKERGVA